MDKKTAKKKADEKKSPSKQAAKDPVNNVPSKQLPKKQSNEAKAKQDKQSKGQAKKSPKKSGKQGKVDSKQVKPSKLQEKKQEAKDYRKEPQKSVQEKSQTKINHSASILSKSNEGSELLISRTSNLIDSVTDLLCRDIVYGGLIVDEQETDLPLRKEPETVEPEPKKELDPEQHKENIKKFKKMSQLYKRRLTKRAQSMHNSILSSAEEQQKRKKQEMERALEKRRELIQQRMKSKAEEMSQIRSQSMLTDENLKKVKSKRFLYEDKEESFQQQFLLPRLQEEKFALEKRTELMKTINLKELLEHEKNYENKKKSSRVNRSLTSRMIESTTLYKPPEFVPKSFMILEAELSLKREEQNLRLKEQEINKMKQKEYVKAVDQIQKLEYSISKSRSKSPTSNDQNDQIKRKKKQTVPRKKLGRAEVKNIGNEYFQTLKKEMKELKAKKQIREKEREQERKRKREEAEKSKDPQKQFELQISTLETRRVEKIEKIEKVHKIRSQKIDEIFGDEKIDPVTKYQKLNNEIKKIDRILHLKDGRSDNINVRSEAASCYLDSIQAKMRLLQFSGVGKDSDEQTQ